MRAAPSRQPFGIAGTVALEHLLKFAPVDRTEIVALLGIVPAQARIGQGQSQEIRLRHREVDEFLPQLIIREALDLPALRIGAVDRLGVRRPEHHESGPPPSIERLLRHALLRGAALREAQHDVVALPLMKTFLSADAHHGPRIGAVGATAQRNLVHDRRAVDQPADGADIGPGRRRIVEYAGILGLARQQLVDQLIAADAESLGGAVQISAVAALVLYFGDQNGFAQQGGRARDPIPLRQHADNLGMGVLRDLADQGGAVSRRHPVLRLDLFFPLDACLEMPLPRHVISRRGRIRPLNIERLRVHAASRPAVATFQRNQTDTYIDSNQFFLCHELLHTAMPLRTPNRPAAARNLVQRLRKQRPLRAGSLIVTIFGDSLMPRGGAVTLGSLIKLATPFGLNERLIRTATARLAHEGWVQARRVGKLSEYRLSGIGRERFAEATQRIYGESSAHWSGRWTLVVLPSLPAAARHRLRRELTWRGFGELASGVFAHPDAPTHGVELPLAGADSSDAFVFQANLSAPGVPARLGHPGWGLGG